MVFQESLTNVLRKFLGCFRGVFSKIDGFFVGISKKKFNGCFKEVFSCLKDVSRNV